ncbi:MAG: tetratricopeptide repeat protein [Methanothrix sp.]|nr:tetratricopeptide repeat protein [Methanothrix sp.]MDD4447461.1 tetratricopeptide repeat protein [Methanothrix sp.]
MTEEDLQKDKSIFEVGNLQSFLSRDKYQKCLCEFIPSVINALGSKKIDYKDIILNLNPNMACVQSNDFQDIYGYINDRACTFINNISIDKIPIEKKCNDENKCLIMNISPLELKSCSKVKTEWINKSCYLPIFVLHIRNEELNKILESETNSITFAETGESLRKKGCYNEAIKAFDKAIAFDSTYAWAFERKGAALRDLSLYEDSIAALNKALEIDPKNAWTHVELGESLRINGQPEKAIEEFDNAISINPDLGWAFERKGATLRDIGNYYDSIGCLKHAIELDPENAWIYAELGESLHKNGKREEALEAFDLAINMDLKKAWVFERLGVLLNNLGRYNRASDALKKSLEIEPQNVQTLVELSESLRYSGHVIEALQVVNHALSISPKFLWAKASKAAIWNELNCCENALKLINEVLMNDNRYLYAKKIKALILNNSARYDEALTTIEEVITIEKERYWSLVIKGWIQENLGKFEEALETYEIAIHLENKFDIDRIKCCAYLGSGNSCYVMHLRSDKNKNDYQNRSIENYEKALELLKAQIDNIDAYTLSRMGWCQFRLGNYDEAERLFIDALSLHPERIESQFFMVLTLICRGKYDLALDECNSGIKLATTESDPTRCRGLLSMSLRYLNETLEDHVELKENKVVKAITQQLEYNL